MFLSWFTAYTWFLTTNMCAYFFSRKFADVCVKSIERFNRRKSSPAILKDTDVKKFIPGNQIAEET